MTAFVRNLQQYKKIQRNRKRKLKHCPHTTGKTTGLCNAETKCKDSSNIHIFLLQTNNYRESTPYREMLTKIELAQFVHRRKKKVKRNGDSKCSHTWISVVFRNPGKGRKSKGEIFGKFSQQPNRKKKKKKVLESGIGTGPKMTPLLRIIILGIIKY